MKTRTNQPITDTPIEYNDKTKTVEVGTNLEVDGIVKGNGLGIDFHVVKTYSPTTSVTYNYEDFFDSGDGVYKVEPYDLPSNQELRINLYNEQTQFTPYVIMSGNISINGLRINDGICINNFIVISGNAQDGYQIIFIKCGNLLFVTYTTDW